MKQLFADTTIGDIVEGNLGEHSHICEIILKDGGCYDNCEYQKDGCCRGDSCAYNHSDTASKLYKNNDKNEDPGSNDNSNNTIIMRFLLTLKTLKEV